MLETRQIEILWKTARAERVDMSINRGDRLHRWVFRGGKKHLLHILGTSTGPTVGR